MTRANLPSKLAKEPLIDVIFEVRFTGSVPGTTLLPGLLFNKITGITNIEPLSASQLPQSIRDGDPNLQFAPLNRLSWGDFAILVGDRSLSVGCKMPYPGWTRFKAAILEVVEVFRNAPFVTTIDRYALKYVDFFETGSDLKKAVEQFDISLRLGKHQLSAENTMIRIEISRPPYLHAVQIMTLANIQAPGMVGRSGAVLDVDTLVVESFGDVPTLLADFAARLDAIHWANKEVFFESLNNTALEELGPSYE